MYSLQLAALAILIVQSVALPWLGPQATTIREPTAPGRTTAAPFLHERDDKQFPVGVCGWIGGRGDLQVTCKPHSSCVWQTNLGVIGCCTTIGTDCGIYTSCVDKNAEKQTEDQKDVYTCTADDLCYRNSYPLGYYQWGCGRPKDATTVLTTINGYNGPATLQIALTGDPAPPTMSSEAEPPSPSVVTRTVTKSDETTASSESPTQSPTTTKPPTSDTSSSQTAALPVTTLTAAPEPEQSDNKKPVGAIAGGTVGGIAGVSLIGALLFLLLRSRRRKQHTETPGAAAELESPKPPQEISSWSPSPASEIDTPKPRVASVGALGIPRKAVPPPAPPQTAVELP
ncbi:hypothetical protein VHEMI07893 [[Torrubiella] hemipterigena]|uniref:Mid2 domain-containing protein n=1 Tax=[Torrubiella] hemipterigena TaxID=1531966 RepID=A0A0A1TNS6_9HYPO|nr:hypothetical protein VHEMI07893 [[Torrubiella] hemipterigena]